MHHIAIRPIRMVVNPRLLVEVISGLMREFQPKPNFAASPKRLLRTIEHQFYPALHICIADRTGSCSGPILECPLVWGIFVMRLFLGFHSCQPSIVPA